MHDLDFGSGGGWKKDRQRRSEAKVLSQEASFQTLSSMIYPSHLLAGLADHNDSRLQ